MRGGGHYLPQKNVDLDAIPTIDDYSEDAPKCEVCGATGTELHHWAPIHIFGAEAWLWPTAYLCQKCHNRWHRLVTPNMHEGK
jgi:5-methylcytosine-specific restriction endonuclease McrA